MFATANDRFANLETNYLLQRIETFEGSRFSPATIVAASIRHLPAAST